MSSPLALILGLWCEFSFLQKCISIIWMNPPISSMGNSNTSTLWCACAGHAGSPGRLQCAGRVTAGRWAGRHVQRALQGPAAPREASGGCGGPCCVTSPQLLPHGARLLQVSAQLLTALGELAVTALPVWAGTYRVFSAPRGAAAWHVSCCSLVPTCGSKAAAEPAMYP